MSDEILCELCGTPYNESLGGHDLCEACAYIFDDMVRALFDAARDNILAARRRWFGDATDVVYVPRSEAPEKLFGAPSERPEPQTRRLCERRARAHHDRGSGPRGLGRGRNGATA